MKELFATYLINTIGLPVVLIGTYKALPLISSEFRIARRSSGQGDLVWDRMSFSVQRKKKVNGADEDWPVFIESLWELQYVKKKCPLTEELSKTLYNVSYGIADLAIRIYMASQVRAIETGGEEVNADLLYSTCRDDFRLVNHILETLRSGSMSPINILSDVLPPSIQPVHELATKGMATSLPEDSNESSSTRHATEPVGVENETQAVNIDGNSVVGVVSGRDSIGTTKVGLSKPPKSCRNSNYAEDDLRGIIQRGKETSPRGTAYQALLEAGAVKAIDEYI